MKNLTKLGFISGGFIILYSIIRWGGIGFYIDYSNMIFGILIGIIICGFAYFLNWMSYKDMKIQNLEERIDSLVISLKDRDLIKMTDLEVK